jgi:hypothetical protein
MGIDVVNARVPHPSRVALKQDVAFSHTRYHQLGSTVSRREHFDCFVARPCTALFALTRLVFNNRMTAALCQLRRSMQAEARVSSHHVSN